MTRIPRLIIAGTHSGVGKTTVAVGLMAALVRRGLRVQPFKAGPDYIDPSYHAVATGRVSRNLDPWLLTQRQVCAVFQHASAVADLAIIEGVMGVFDGHHSTSDRGSTAELARWLRAPVILVVDAGAMARSVAALVRGYVTFDPRLRVAGVILNRVGERHFQLLREALRRTVPVPVLGYLAADATLAIPERHLGLLPAQEDPERVRLQDRLATMVPRTIDLPRVVRIAAAASPLPAAPWPGQARAASRPAVTIGVARDRAFHFYYQDNLDLLRAYGARLVEFSPLVDARLPQDLDALYLGGGFPERFAAPLQQNAPMRRAVRRAIARGVPTYAECGGLMYLAQRLIDEAGRAHAMVGVLPGTVRMTHRLQQFGYATVTPRRATILAAARDAIKGHEFHYSTWDHAPSSRHAAYLVTKRRETARLEGFARGNLLASYIHVHFLANVRWARGFVASARMRRSRAAIGLLWALWLGMQAAAGWAADPSRLEAVVVTATRGELPEAKVTKSVSVVTHEAIERAHADTALEVLRHVPGVYVRRSGAVGRITSAVIRGSTDAQVLVLIDGVDAGSPTLGSFNWSTLPADAIERIEVLRGSASTLYGASAIGGVINLITTRGHGPMRTSYQQEFGTLRTFREIISHQAEMGAVRYATSVSRLDSRGLSTGDDVEVTHVAFTADADVAHWLSLAVSLNNNDSRVGIDDGAFRPDPNRYTEREHLALTTTATIKPLEAWEHELRFGFNDDDLLDIDVGDPGSTQATTKSRINTDRYTAEWLQRVAWGPLGLSTGGIEFKDEEAEARFENVVTQWAVFLQHQLDLGDRLTVIGGSRHLRHNSFGHETTAEASASYRIPVMETRVRGNFSMGFRAPTMNELFFPNFGNSNLSPENSRTYEIGMEQDWWRHRLAGAISLYHTEVDDLIQIVRVNSTTSQPLNVAEVEMEGFELEGSVEPMTGLRFSTNWTYTDAEDETADEELLRIPRNQATFALDYDFLERWQLHLDATVVSSREESVATNRRLPTKGYKKVDVALNFNATDRVTLYGRIENLFNRHYSEVLGFPAPGTLFFIGGKIEI